MGTPVVVSRGMLAAMRYRPALALSAAVLAMGGCSAASVASAPPVASAVVTPACLPADALGKAILTGTQSGTGASFVGASAFKSPDFTKVYFVAVKFSAPGVGDQVGVWASSSLEAGGGSIMSVDGIAKGFTDWPDASRTAAGIGADDPSVTAAKDCVG